MALLFLLGVLAAAVSAPLAARLAPRADREEAPVAEALALVATWLDARRAGDDRAAAGFMRPGLVDRGTLDLRPTSNPHIEAYFVYPRSGSRGAPVRVDVVLHEVYTGEAYAALYAEQVDVAADGSAMRIVGWSPAGGPEVSVVPEGPAGRAARLVYEDVSGRRLSLDLDRLPGRLEVPGRGAVEELRAQRFGPVALSPPDGRYAAVAVVGASATVLGVWDTATMTVTPLDVFPNADVVDLHWSRSGSYLAATVRTPRPAGQVSVYLWPEGQRLEPAELGQLGEASLQAVRWDARTEELLISAAPPPGTGTQDRLQPRVWRWNPQDGSLRPAEDEP